nr:unnamed protein product [Callosobruchus chinensis]
MYSQNFEYYPYDNSYTEYYPSTENQLDNENYYYSSEPSVSVDSSYSHNRGNLIDLNTIYDKTELPYIEIANPPLKLLIDTGATKSFLNPELAYKYFPKNIYKEPFEVTSVFQHSKRDYFAEIPAFPEFNIREPIKFHLFKFHKYFDEIGLDILKLLNSHIDLGNSMLHTKNANAAVVCGLL